MRCKLFYTLLTFVCLLTSVYCNGQSRLPTGQASKADELRLMRTYTDAEELEKLYLQLGKGDELHNLRTLKSIHTILNKNYYWDPSYKKNFILSQVLKLEAFFHDFDTNMVLGNNDGNNDVYVKNAQPKTNTSAFSSEAAIINAVATFMANRTKQEVLYYAIDRIFSISESENEIGKIFSTILPMTKNLIKKLKKAGVYYASDFDLIRQMIELDVINLPATIPSVLSKDPLTIDLLFTTGRILLLSKRGQTVPELIDELSSKQWENKYYASTMKSMQIMTNSLIEKKGKLTKWVEDDKLTKLKPLEKDTSIFQQFYYGLLLQQMLMQEDRNIDQILSNYMTVGSYKKFTQKMYASIEVVQNVKKIDLAFKNVSKEFDINWVLKTSDDLTTTIFDFMAFSGLQQELSLPTNIRSDINAVTEITKLIYAKNVQGALTALILKLATSDEISIEELRKLIFFVELSKIKSPDQFENFMTTYAAPIGSSSLKRSASFNISLNGYVGLNGGYEFIKGSKTKDQNNSGIVGVTAPIGVSFSFAPSKCGSFSFFMSALDLGSLVNMRFKNDSTNYSKLRFEHFFTPGFGLSYNFRKTPLTLGVFGNYINNVRTIEYTSGNTIITETNKSVYRATVSLLIDIPFFTIYNRNRK